MVTYIIDQLIICLKIKIKLSLFNIHEAYISLGLYRSDLFCKNQLYEMYYIKQRINVTNHVDAVYLLLTLKIQPLIRCKQRALI